MLPSYTLLLKKLRNFPKALNVTIFFSAILTDRGIGDIEKRIKKNDIYVL